MGLSNYRIRSRLRATYPYLLYLLHRPLSHHKIFLALSSAGCCLLLVIIFLPTLFMLIIMDMEAIRGIETRHYMTLIAIAGPVLIAYFCGGFAILGPGRTAFMALAMATVYVVVYVKSALVVTTLMLICWSFYIAFVSFKPDLGRHFTRIHELILTEIPVQYGIFGLLTMALYMGNGALESSKGFPEPGSAFFVWQLPAKERMQLALENSNHPDSGFLNQQVILGEVSAVRNPDTASYPLRNQLTFTDNKLTQGDGENNVLWRFSHGRMLFEGFNLDTDERIGWLGPDGFSDGLALPETLFKSVPEFEAGDFIVDGNIVYQVDWDERRIYRRYVSNQADRLSDSLTVSDNVTTLFSEKYLYIFDTREFANHDVKLEPRAILEIPASDISDPDLQKFHVLGLIDGYLVSAVVDLPPTTLAPDFALYGRSQLRLYRIGAAKGNELISTLDLASGVGSEYVIYSNLIASPGMRLLTDLFWGLYLGKSPARTLPMSHVSFPAGVVTLALLICLFSAGLTTWLLRNSTLPVRIKAAWIVLNGATGLAGLLSFVIGHYWRKPDEMKISRKFPVSPGLTGATACSGGGAR